MEKSSGKKQDITIRAEKGRLSDEEIEQMVADEEANRESDSAYAAKVEARNSLEGYVYSLRNTFLDDNLKSKLSEANSKTATDAIDGALSWLDDNPSAEKRECEEKQKELQDAVLPILQAAQAGGSGEPKERSRDTDPTVEEVD
mmetsp:Transcript_11307/g.14259  ORF Transcript_11307/g.14259 Transcript_11307/m.14259 type:complete len:144 (-) Transcript_11307:127-558(-)